MDLSLDVIGAHLLQNRRLMRAPIWLYRHGLGILLGPRILMLEHVGRTSGLPRYVCLEVVERPSPSVILIVSGFGERSQWYRNLKQQPECFVSVGSLRRVPAKARFVPQEEAAQVLVTYRDAHPTAWRRLRGAIEEAVGHEVEGLPMVELTLSRN